MKVYEKILRARAIIREQHIEKKGKNTFAKYNYFTPDQIASMVNRAAQEVGLLNVFSLKADNFGTYGQLTVMDIESGNEITAEMRTEIPTIKATNAAQQVGGCATYTERYMLQSMYQIADNDLDFDSDPPKKRAKPEKKRKVLTPAHPRFNEFIEMVKTGAKSADEICAAFDEVHYDAESILEETFEKALSMANDMQKEIEDGRD